MILYVNISPGELMKNSLRVGVLVLLLAACGQDQKLANSDIEKIGDTLEKAADDVSDEGKRFNNSFNDTKQDGLESLADANQAFNDEEHRFSGRTKDTLAKANEDVNNEEHLFNDKFKTSTKKANMDTISEGDKLTDRVVGSDDTTVDQHGDDIRDLQRRMALVEQVNQAQSTALNLHYARIEQLETRATATEADLASTNAHFLSEVARLDAGDVSLQAELTAAVEALSASIASEVSSRVMADAQLVDDLLAEVASRQAADVNLQTQVTALSGSLSTLTTNYNNFKSAQLLNNFLQQGQLFAAGMALANLSSRMSAAESDIASLETAVLAIQSSITVINGTLVTNSGNITALQSSMTSLSNLVSNLQTAINSSCTISRNSGTVESYELCDSVNWGGHCTDWDSYSFRAATVTLQCLGKPAQTLTNVLFKN